MHLDRRIRRLHSFLHWKISHLKMILLSELLQLMQGFVTHSAVREQRYHGFLYQVVAESRLRLIDLRSRIGLVKVSDLQMAI